IWRPAAPAVGLQQNLLFRLQANAPDRWFGNGGLHTSGGFFTNRISQLRLPNVDDGPPAAAVGLLILRQLGNFMDARFAIYRCDLGGPWPYGFLRRAPEPRLGPRSGLISSPMIRPMPGSRRPHCSIAPPGLPQRCRDPPLDRLSIRRFAEPAARSV